MAKSSSHKSQHYIPKSYLAAWCDPETPAGMHPYVWTFPPDGGAGIRRAPQNLFTENNIYTITMPDGSRDLRIEHYLSQLEKGLKSLVTDYIARHRELPSHRHEKLVAFIAAMHARTPHAREIQRTFWQNSLDAAEEKARDPQFHLKIGPQENVDGLRKAVKSPMQFIVPGAVVDGFPHLVQMTMTIFCTENPTFVTSDSPVFWSDPTIPRENLPTHKKLLTDPGIQVTMPLSPRHMIMLHHPMTPFIKPVTYVAARASTAAAFNRRTIVYANEAIVSWRDGFDPSWQIFPRASLNGLPGHTNL